MQGNPPAHCFALRLCLQKRDARTLHRQPTSRLDSSDKIKGIHLQGDSLTSVNGRKHATSEPKGRADRLWECRQKLLRSATRPFLDSDCQAYAWRRVSLRCNQLMQKAYPPLAADMPRRHPRSLRRSSGWRAIVGTAPHRGRRPGREAARRSAIRRGPRSRGWNRFNRRRLLRSDSPARHPINQLVSLHHSTRQTASNVSRESKASMHHHAAGGRANGVSE